MKREVLLTLALIAFLVTSCDNDFDCGCKKYYLTDDVVDSPIDLLESQNVPCQPESTINFDEKGNRFFVRCN